MDETQGYGWRLFAGIVLMIAGIMRVFDGIWAFRYHGAIPEGLQNALFGTTLSTYGWLWLIVGIVVFLSGLVVLSENRMETTTGQIGRWVGIIAGAIIAISSIWWMPYYPIWSIAYIGVGVAVIYGLTAYGKRAAS